MQTHTDDGEISAKFTNVRGKLATLADIALLFGVAHETVRKWVAAGCPAVRKSDGSKGGPGWQFSTADVIAWYAAREKASVKRSGEHVDLEEAKRRKLAAEAELAELDAAERRGELVRIADVAAIVADEFSSCRAKLLGMATKLAPILAATTDINETRATIEVTMREALDELRYAGGSLRGADSEAESGADEGEDGRLEAAAEADGQPMGGQIPQAEPGKFSRTGAMDHGAQ